MISLNFYNAIYQTIAIFLCFPGMGADFIKKKNYQTNYKYTFLYSTAHKTKKHQKRFYQN